MAPFNIWSDWLNWVSSLERIHNGRAVLLALSMSLARCRYKTGNWTRCPFQWSSPRCVAIHRTEHELRTLQESKPNCLSRVLSKRLNEWSWSLAWGLHSIFKHLQGNLSASEIRALSSGTLPQTLDLENFATASRSRCRQNSTVWRVGVTGCT